MEARIRQDTNVIADNLRRLREAQGLKQHEVAARLQVMGLPVTREIYAQIETGRHGIPISVLQGLRKIYRVDWEELLPRDDNFDI